MALSEGLKGFVSFFTKSFNDGSDESAFEFGGMDDYGNDIDGTLALDTMYGTRVKPERSFERESKVISHPNNTYKSGEVTVIEPRSFSESAQIVKKLLDNKTVILHLDLLDKEQSQRTIDFVCGASQALNGSPKKVGDLVFVFAPSNVTLSADTAPQQSKFNDSLWRTSLQ